MTAGCTKNPNTCSYAHPQPGNPECPECSLTHEECQETLSSNPGGVDVSTGPIDACENLEESYGCICVNCNRCGRFDPNV